MHIFNNISDETFNLYRVTIFIPLNKIKRSKAFYWLCVEIYLRSFYLFLVHNACSSNRILLYVMSSKKKKYNARFPPVMY